MTATKEKLILKSNLCPGDILTLTAAVESLHATYRGEYLTDVRTPVSAIWEHNPWITPLEEAESRVLQMHYPTINECNQIPHCFLAGYTEYLGKLLNRPLRLRTNRPHLYITETEKGWLNQFRELDPAHRDRPFWLVNAGIKSDYTAKAWPIEYFQEVVNATRGRIQWVQVGAREHEHPRLDGVVDLRGKTDHRQLIRLAWHARAGLGPVTYLMHLMAAWEKPYLCLLGGREPVTWVQYPRQVTFHTIGQLPCCRDRACWKARVAVAGDGDQKDSKKSLCERPIWGLERPVAECMARIRPEEVIQVLERIPDGV